MRDLATRLRETLSGRYAIKREIGRGGMATVFLAHDLRHDRDVALKVLHPAIASGVGSRRFEQEIRLAARLQHPHIVAVHDSGVAPDGPGEPDLLWFTMPFIEGESLRDRLRREGQLPIGDAVRITRQVSDALDYAHRHGVIHRDIKPENILLTENHALVTDFGVAIAATHEDGTPVDTLTAAGTTVGTVTYMSPEQCSAERHLDARSDQYAVGTVLYEMLVGEPPFTGPTSQVVMTRRFNEDPRPLRTARPGVPESVERVVTTALARLPADRYATMNDFGVALDSALTSSSVAAPRQNVRSRWATAGAIAAAIAVLAFGAWRLLPAGDAQMLLAVLPFEVTGDSADAYLGEALAFEVSGKLANFPEFALIANSTTSEYRRRDKPYEQIADEMRTRLLLTGTMNWARSGEEPPGGERLMMVRAELIEVTRQGVVLHRWSEQFSFAFTDVFEFQSAIANKIARALQIEMTPETKAALAAVPTSNSAAYAEFLRGEQVYLGSSGPRAQEEAMGRYESAVALDTSFARAWARLSQTYSSIYARTIDSSVAVRAQRAAEHALRLDPGMPEAYLAMGNQYTLVQSDYARAIEQYQEGLKLQPDHAELLGALGLAFQGLGRYDEAIDYMRQGLRLDPRSLLFWRRLTRALTYAGSYAEAEEASRQSLAINPTDISALQYAVLLRLAQGDLEGARAITRSLPKDTDLPRLLSYWSTNFPITGWFLDDEPKKVIMRLPPSAWDDSLARLQVMQILAFRRGDKALARTYADSIGRAQQYRIPQTSDPNWKLVFGSWASLVGREAEAIRESEAAVAARANDQLFGPQMRHNLIQVCLQAGDYERALDHLEILVKQKYLVTPAWLRIDPSFDLIRNNPRFQAIINSAR